MRKDFHKEARKMWQVISSQFVVSVMGMVDAPDGGICILMEYLEYGSLRHFTPLYMVAKDDDGKWRSDCWPRRIRMIYDIILGMNYLHTSSPPITHRDLKLENVFVGPGFRVKVCNLI